MRRFSALMALGSFTLMIYPANLARADGEIVRQVSAVCQSISVNATYKPLSSDYKLSGTCAVHETSANGQTSVHPGYVIDWAATASHQPNTKATFETMTLTLFELGKATGSSLS